MKYNNENNEENIIFDAGHAGFRQLLGRYKKKVTLITMK